MKKIVITHSSITTPLEEAMKCRIKDRGLIDCMCTYRKEIEKEGVEVFKRWDNIIVTENGFNYALYEEELESIQSPKPPVPFKGEDGRQKVILKNKKGEKCIEDVATMVAMGFIPNPSGLKYVKFKDGNPNNCQADNLYWSETE